MRGSPKRDRMGRADLAGTSSSRLPSVGGRERSTWNAPPASTPGPAASGSCTPPGGSRPARAATTCAVPSKDQRSRGPAPAHGSEGLISRRWGLSTLVLGSAVVARFSSSKVFHVEHCSGLQAADLPVPALATQSGSRSHGWGPPRPPPSGGSASAGCGSGARTRHTQCQGPRVSGSSCVGSAAMARLEYPEVFHVEHQSGASRSDRSRGTPSRAQLSNVGQGDLFGPRLGEPCRGGQSWVSALRQIRPAAPSSRGRASPRDWGQCSGIVTQRHRAAQVHSPRVSSDSG